MTIIHCSWHVDLVRYFSFYISSCISVSFRNLITFTTLKLFPSSVSMSPWILYFFLLSIHWGQFCRKFFIVSICFPHAAFLQAGGGSFLEIRCPWVSLECPIRILLNLISHCLQLLYALSHSSMRGYIECSLRVLFSHSLCHSEFLALLMVR